MLRRLIFLVFLIAFTVAVKPAAAKGHKWALVVGVGRYKSPDAPPLRGPLNDVPAITQLLTERYRFPAENVRVLLNETATRDAILQGWEWLIQRAEAGDQAVFYFSGHGTQIPDPTKPNGTGSALCPYDAAPNTLIAGREIRSRIDRMRTDNIVVIVDACHSGLASRSPFIESRLLPLSVIGGNQKIQPALSKTPSLLTERGQGMGRERFFGAAQVGKEASGFPFLKTQRPTDNPMMGALTYYLLDELRRDLKGTLTYAELARRVTEATRAKAYQTNTPSQEPVCTGPDLETTSFLQLGEEKPTKNAAASGTEAVPAIAQVRSVRGREITLDAVAGAVLESGDQLVLAAATTSRLWRIALKEEPVRVSRSKGEFPLVRVDAAHGLTASGTLLRGAIAKGDRLYLAVREQEEAPLAVALDGSKAKELTSTLRALPFVHISTGAAGETAHVVLQTKGERILPVRQGTPLNSIAPSALRRQLESLQAVQILADFTCPQPSFQMRLTVNGASSRTQAFIGDEISPTIETDKDVWVLLVSVNATGEISGFPEPFLVRANRPAPVGPIKVEGPAGFDLLRAFAFPTRPDIHLPSNPDEAAKLGATPYAVARATIGLLRKAANEPKFSDAPPFTRDEQSVTATGWAASDLLIEIQKEATP